MTHPPANTLPADGVESNWLLDQLEQWPKRVHPERTTNIEYLMKSAAERIRQALTPTNAATPSDEVEEDAYGRVGERVGCWVCHGSGTEYGETCVTCGGFGWVNEERQALARPVPIPSAEVETLIREKRDAWMQEGCDSGDAISFLDTLLEALARPVPADVAEVVEKLRYRVNNPSAWDSYDEAASELIRKSATLLTAKAQEVERARGDAALMYANYTRVRADWNAERTAKEAAEARLRFEEALWADLDKQHIARWEAAEAKAAGARAEALEEAAKLIEDTVDAISAGFLGDAIRALGKQGDKQGGGR